MTARIELRSRAHRDLWAIQEWTEARFGVHQAETYMDGFATALARIGEDTIASRTCDRLTGLARHGALRSVRSGRHLIVYRRFEDEIAVLTILHDASDITRHLGALLPSMKDP
ncbi:MAG: type II toxin-antitoxin system RelE/ParE family toxin [Shimia sp.]